MDTRATVKELLSRMASGNVEMTAELFAQQDDANFSRDASYDEFVRAKQSG